MFNIKNLTSAYFLPVLAFLPVSPAPENARGLFALIVGIFSILVVILLVAFISGWYLSKWAENKRYRRILMSQRDTIAAYNVIKKDTKEALKSISGKEFGEGKINELEFFLRRIDDNLEKMNKYVVGGINVIGKYDIINKIYKTNKNKKT
ncbi:MAG: hypothetical protein US35_C0003G0003 [Parcubacteria group bacterium GW2011_GWA2_37_10]|nr:MAG: hypothetical protein US35_C0003G0003 [Parcubacteria group bacterium GW2011_GWA2_37_10]